MAKQVDNFEALEYVSHLVNVLSVVHKVKFYITKLKANQN